MRLGGGGKLIATHPHTHSRTLAQGMMIFNVMFTAGGTFGNNVLHLATLDYGVCHWTNFECSNKLLVLALGLNCVVSQFLYAAGY
jgi:hypothetical protein